MADYKTLSVRELLDLRDRDQGALLELLRRQNAGILNRMYDQPRKGPQDLGLTVFVVNVQDYHLGLHTGVAGRYHTFTPEDARKYVQVCRVAIETLRLVMLEKGFSEAAIQRRYQEHQSPMSVDVIREDNGTMLVRLHPLDRVEWTLGPETCELFCNALEGK